MIPPTIERWEHVVKSRDSDLLDHFLADDVVFESPVVHTPQVGRAITRAYLAAALQVLNGPEFRYIRRWLGEQSAVLEFETRLADLTINGVDIINWNSEDRINRFKVMIRPLKAINAVHQAMGQQLAASSQRAEGAETAIS
ncbi:MAG: nuclear transport factor 2 family protein [Hyphomicrobiales bacterium]|nr:nuclear transport factor 2 family protein [Hyphomicrobiales bacterium]